MVMVAFLSTKVAMESSKEHKCPEYEKVENVYKLKEKNEKYTHTTNR
jgi:hypothetical protein